MMVPLLTLPLWGGRLRSSKEGSFRHSKRAPSPSRRSVPPTRGRVKWPTRVLTWNLFRHHTHIGQLPERMADIHAITDDKIVGAFEAFEIRFDVGLALHALVEQHGDGNAAGAALAASVRG